MADDTGGVSRAPSATRLADAERAWLETFRRLVENSPFGIYIVDADFRLMLVSAGAEKVFSTVDVLIGRDFAEIMRLLWEEPFATETIDRFRHTLASGEPYHSPRTTETRYASREIESYDWKIERIALPDRRLGVVCHFYDLSERLHYEERLRESDIRFRGTFENSAVGIAHVGLDGVWREVNDRLCSILGYSRGQLLSLTFHDVTFPDDLEAYLDNVRKLLNGEIQSYSMDKRYVRPDGGAVWCNLTVSLQRDKAGAPDYFISVIRDIAASKEVEEFNLFLMRELQHRTKNQLAIVQAMSSQTARHAPSLEAFQVTFSERIRALSTAIDLLVDQNWASAPLLVLVRRQLEIIGPQSSRLKCDGPNVFVSADAAQSIGLALHELATNCVKYGAWSAPEGIVEIKWRAQSGGSDSPPLRIEWVERAGPLVEPPTRKGFGHVVIDRLVAQRLNGSVEIKFDPAGFSWTLLLPGDQYTDDWARVGEWIAMRGNC